MKPMSLVMGWHSYKKDLEREYITLTSRYGHRVEGLKSNFWKLLHTPQMPIYRKNEHLAVAAERDCQKP